MKYSDFLKLLMTHRKINEEFSELSDMGFDFFEGKYRLVEHVESIVDTAFSSVYTTDGVGWIWWFVYENEYGQRDWSSVPSYERDENGNYTISNRDKDKFPATDEDGNSICHSYQSLWEYIEKNHKKVG